MLWQLIMDDSLVAKTESREFFRSLCPGQSVSDGFPPPLALRVASETCEQRRTLAGQGYMVLEDLAPADACAAVASCIQRLLDAGLPPVYVLAYDLTWGLLRDVGEAVGQVAGRPYTVLPDFWAWHIRPARGQSGWPPHRDFRKVIVRGVDGLPDRVNTWISLTDAPVDHACMSLVPLPADPDYPLAIEKDEATRGWQSFPTKVGTALVWDANVLHRGGPANPDAPFPRVSMAVTLQVPERGEPALNFSSPLPFQKRLDIVATQILRYERRAPEVPTELRAWARILYNLREKLSPEQIR